MSREEVWEEESWDNVLVVVGIDFGTTYSGFSYRHVASDSKEVITNDQWSDNVGQFKTNTALQYDNEFNKVIKWGKPALAKRQSRRSENKVETKPVELFKLHLGNLNPELKPKLSVDYKKAITDYLREIGELIRKTLKSTWDDVDLLKNVLLVLSVPAEYSEKEKAIMRECAYMANLICDQKTKLLQFTTEPEAAAVYCMEKCLKEYSSTGIGTSFMIVDSGGGTVDLTTRKLVDEKKVGEVTERAGDYCGSSFVDKAFLEYLGNILGHSAIDNLRENSYQRLQYIVQKFCRRVKHPFTGDDEEFHYELDLLEVRDELKNYVTGSAKKLMEENDWMIDIKYKDIKSMFDPTIEKILNLISVQLENSRNECSTMFLVGGFSQSVYLQNCIKRKFKDKVKTITVPGYPIAAVVRGNTLYGLGLYNKTYKLEDVNFELTTRVLKFTYGIEIYETWKETDPIERKNTRGDIRKFYCIAKRGETIEIDKEIIIKDLVPISASHKIAVLAIFCTRDYDAKYCDEPGMELLGKLKINFSNRTNNGQRGRINFGLSFGKMEITATAKNETSGQNYLAIFEIDKEKDNPI